MELRIRHIPVELHRELKIGAIREGRTVNAIVLSLIERYVREAAEREKKKPR
jgi:plasmid stability protein